MQTTAEKIIDALGGTTPVARLMGSPISTVHSWRKNGIPPWRLAQLRVAAQECDPPVDIDAIVQEAAGPALAEGAAA
ncbi:hypothetical protein K7957_05185 [Sphingomonas yunnanensis]|uniref:carph-isopro domain-containing protein n=1 Tax=Sphingomonas yunnanensis TaxID=310400 RepID=UPI001CA76412|nr:hypothetical protein [Sphingomonas yunnanensis]MBY9062323.1 hypothetical protein [Sphingomonas yunnanensis]